MGLLDPISGRTLVLGPHEWPKRGLQKGPKSGYAFWTHYHGYGLLANMGVPNGVPEVLIRVLMPSPGCWRERGYVPLRPLAPVWVLGCMWYMAISPLSPLSPLDHPHPHPHLGSQIGGPDIGPSVRRSGSMTPYPMTPVTMVSAVRPQWPISTSVHTCSA